VKVHVNWHVDFLGDPKIQKNLFLKKKEMPKNVSACKAREGDQNKK